jgi:transposase
MKWTGMAKAIGFRFARSSAASFHRKALAEMPPSLAAALTPVVECIEHLSEQIKHYEQEIERRANEAYPQTKSLQTVPGVGFLTALAFVLTIEEPSRFRKSRDVAGFFGLVPRREQSGQSDPQRRITKAGDPYVRRLLVNCAQFITGGASTPAVGLRRGISTVTTRRDGGCVKSTDMNAKAKD